MSSFVSCLHTLASSKCSTVKSCSLSCELCDHFSRPVRLGAPSPGPNMIMVMWWSKVLGASTGGLNKNTTSRVLHRLPSPPEDRWETLAEDRNAPDPTVQYGRDLGCLPVSSSTHLLMNHRPNHGAPGDGLYRKRIYWGWMEFFSISLQASHQFFGPLQPAQRLGGHPKRLAPVRRRLAVLEVLFPVRCSVNQFLWFEII